MSTQTLGPKNADATESVCTSARRLLRVSGECLPANKVPVGLSSTEAAHRLRDEGPNVLPGEAPKSLIAIARAVLAEPMFLLLLGAGGIYLTLGDRAEASFLLGFVFLVIGITLAQERRTHRALEALRDLSSPRACVLRDGTEQRIPGADVVRGDIIVLREGDRVPADAWLLHGQLSIDESLLTGESVPVAKVAAMRPPNTQLAAPGGEGTASLFASTVVTRGIGMAEVCATAGATAVGRIGKALSSAIETPSALQRVAGQFVRNLGVGAVVLACAQVLVGYLWDRRPILESLLSGIALAMAILPEEIPVIVTVFLALGAWRISRQKVLTRRIAAVEALGAITVLAVDKTGTLTQNKMAVAALVVGDAHFVSEGAQGLPEDFHALVEFGMLATPADPFDPMERAIRTFGRQWLTGTEHMHDGRSPQFEYPLSSDILAMTRVFSGNRPTQHLLATKGAPEAVFDLCHMPTSEREARRRQIEVLAHSGLRVLGVARGQWEPGMQSDANAAAPTWPNSQHDFDFQFLGLIGLADPPRPEVSEALARCRRAGVRVIMLTGDHPATALAVARQVGLSESPEVLTGAQIDALDGASLRARLRHVAICARVQPANKLRLVQELRGAGEVVAMTGDGVNDAPALKAADVGIAMGQRGTDVAREAASLVLLDDSFARIVATIEQGRRIFENIGKATRFAIAVHVPIIGLALVPALLDWPILLLPVQIVLLELLIDPACSVVFEAEPADADIMNRPPRRLDATPFSSTNVLAGVAQGAGLALILLLAYFALRQVGASVEQDRGAVFLVLSADVLLLTLANRRGSAGHLMLDQGRNPWVGRMAVGVVMLLVAANLLPALRNVLGLAPFNLQGAWVAIIAAILSVTWLAWLRHMAQRRLSDGT
ncbi:MAG TPA: cation-translocating P-type ATPase [Burkholderiaceae bacterium]|nr:cation-translocating P-type ATPase [Burkholderiaceae bacterium]